MGEEQARLPYWRLSNFYFFYFASLGALLPYWGLYLQSLGFNAVQIGQLMAILSATKIVAPNIWGWISDRTGQRMSIVRFACLCAACTFAAVLLTVDYWWLALIMSVYSFFWNAALPQFEATTMNHLGGQSHQYSAVRIWGSVGFMATAWGFGVYLDYFAVGHLPYIVLFLFVGIWLAALVVPERDAAQLALQHVPLRKLLRQRAVIALLAVCFLMQFSHGPYYTFYSIYLTEYGYSSDTLGLLWALGVFAEIVVLLWMGRLLPRFGVRFLLVGSLGLTALRWIVIALFPEHFVLLVFAQILHAASFGVYHVVAITMIHALFTGKNQGIGQALYSSLSFGAGGALGSLISGYLWEGYGATVVYLLAALVAAIAAWISLRFMRTD